MRFLVEKSLLSADEDAKYLSLPTRSKYSFINKWIDTFIGDNKNMNGVKSDIANTIMDYGFDTDQNKFLNYLLKLKQLWYPFRLTHEQVELIAYLLNEDRLNPTERWLYLRELYSENPEDVLYKIKALTYASNKAMQRDANRDITPELLMDENNRPLTAKQMQSILSKIKITSDKVSMQNAIDRYFGNIDTKNERNLNRVKKWLLDLIKSSPNYNKDLAERLDNIDADSLIRIPIKSTELKDIRNSVIDFLIGKSNLIANKSKSGLNINALASKSKKSASEIKQTLDPIKDEAERNTKALAVSGIMNIENISKVEAQSIVNNIYRTGMSLDDILNAYATAYGRNIEVR